MKRRNNAAAGIAFGFFLFISAFPLLFWNEGRAVKTARALAEGSKKVISVSADTVDSSNDAALVHLSGNTVTGDTLTDDTLGVSVNAIKLRRNVELFQWQESSGREGSTTSYAKVWSSDLIDSSSFESTGYDNPSSLPLENKTWSAQEVSLGAFWLSSNLINKMDAFEPLRLEPSLLPALEERLGLSSAVMDGAHLFLAFSGGEPSNPQVGDARVKLERVLASPVSVVAEQQGSSLKAFESRSGRDLEMLRAGTLSADEMFDAAVSENNALTWGMRIFGLLLMGFSIRLLFRPLTAITSFIPGLGSIVRLGVNAVSAVLAFTLSLVTVSLAWFTYRPLIAIPLVVLGLLAFFVAQRMGKTIASEA